MDSPRLTITWGAPLLLAAAQFASNDAAKQTLTQVCIRRQEEHLWIGSSNGHYAFRTRVPLDGVTFQAHMDGDELRLNAHALRKHSARARSVLLRGDELLLLDSKAQAIDIRPDAFIPEDKWAGSFPNLDQLWPDRFSYQTAGPIGMNARYLKEMTQALDRIDAAYGGSNVCKLRFNGQCNPLTLSAGWFPSDDLITAEILLMPVQVRDDGDKPDIDIPHRPISKQAKPKQDPTPAPAEQAQPEQAQPEQAQPDPEPAPATSTQAPVTTRRFGLRKHPATA